MSTSNSSDESAVSERSEEETARYMLVEFVKRGPKSVKSVDVVPSKWVSFDRKKAKLISKYMDPPYQEEDYQLIQTLTAGNADAPEGWTDYPVVIKGYADTYSSAVAKLSRLNHNEFAFTPDSKADPSAKAKATQLRFKTMAFKAKQHKLRTMIRESEGPSVSPEASTKPNSNTQKPSLPQSSPELTREPSIMKTPLTTTSNGPIQSRRLVLDVEKRKKACQGATPKALVQTTLEEQVQNIGRRLDTMDARLKLIEESNANILATLRQQHSQCTKEQAVNSPSSFNETYGTDLPCESVTHLEHLNEVLKSNPKSCHDLKQMLRFTVDVGHGVSRAASRIMKFLAKREFVLKLTAQKQVPGKTVIKGTPVFDIISNLLRDLFQAESEKKVFAAIGDAITNAKDWDGFRKKRQSQAQ